MGGYFARSGITQKLAILAILTWSSLNWATLTGGQVRNRLAKALGISRNIAPGHPGISRLFAFLRTSLRSARGAYFATVGITQKLAILATLTSTRPELASFAGVLDSDGDTPHTPSGGVEDGRPASEFNRSAAEGVTRMLRPGGFDRQ